MALLGVLLNWLLLFTTMINITTQCKFHNLPIYLILLLNLPSLQSPLQQYLKKMSSLDLAEDFTLQPSTMLLVVDKYMFCHIISFMPYFYQSKFKRLNKYTLKWIEYNQKYLLIQRILKFASSEEMKKKHPDYYEHIVKDSNRVLLELDDLKHVEREDFVKCDLFSMMEDPEKLLEFIKQFYYLNDKRWLLYWNNVGDAYFSQKTIYDTDMLFDRKYEEAFQLEGNVTMLDEHIASHFFINLTVIGVKTLSVPLPQYLDTLYMVGIAGVEFLFSSLEPSSGEPSTYYHLFHSAIPFFTNCFTSVRKKKGIKKIRNCVPLKTNIQSRKGAEKYLLQCAQAHNVHPSLIPLGELFVYSMFDTTNYTPQKDTKARNELKQKISVKQKTCATRKASQKESFPNPCFGCE